MQPKTTRNAAICEAVRNGATYVEVGKKWGISAERALQICARQGVRSLNCQRLSHKEEEKIVRLFRAGMRPQHIADAIGRHHNAVSRYLTRVGLRTRDNHGIAQDRWTDEEDAILKDLHSTSSMKHVAEKLGRTTSEVIGRAWRLGLKKRQNHKSG